MSEKTLIAWTEHTWNPWRGCTKVSPGCDNCYMFTAQERYGRNPAEVVRCGKSIWQAPARWNREAENAGKPAKVFTCSWSDWFHEDADRWRPAAWDIVRETPWLQYQILTKRPHLIADRLPPDWGDGYPNVWLGVSIESNVQRSRAETLRKVPAAVRFISYEPALGPLDKCDLTGLHWVIYGGESGPGYRPEDKQWARDMRDRCRELGIAFFHKQSAAPRTEMGIELDGEIIREYPEAAHRNVAEAGAAQATLALRG